MTTAIEIATLAKAFLPHASKRHILLDLKELDVEDQSAVGGNAGKGTAAVGKVRGDGETTLTTNSHASNTDVPTLDHLTLAELEGERGTLLVGCIKY